MKIRIIIMCVICIGLLGCSDKVQDVSTAQNDSVNMLDNKHYVDESEDLKSEFDKEDISTGVDVDTGDESDYIKRINAVHVERPVERSKKEILQRLKKLGETDPVIKEIRENASLYPDKMLEALANNPEMSDFVFGYTDNDNNIKAEFSEKEIKQDYPLFLQWDPRWGYKKYGDSSNIGLAGCGPTCLSMVLFYLTRDETLTPDKIADYSMKHGYYVQGTGTAWSLMSDVPAIYGINSSNPSMSEESLKSELDRGRVIICAMNKGDFTVAGHFIVIYGYKKEGFMVNDPNCVSRSRRLWTYEELSWQVKNVWSFGKGGAKRQKIDGDIEFYIVDVKDK